MRFSISQVLLVAYATSIASGSVLRKRAALSPAKILEEISNLQGRNWCNSYINAQVLVLPDYETAYETKWFTKTSTTKTTSSSTEVIGTLRKGTSTLTVTSAIPARTTTYTETTTAISYERQTSVTTVLVTVTVPYVPPVLRRRQAIERPAALADSDPQSISAACTKVVNKYPVYVTSAQTTTKSTSGTYYEQFTSVIVKTIKITQINPYLVRTTTVTIPAGPEQTEYAERVTVATITSTIPAQEVQTVKVTTTVTQSSPGTEPTSGGAFDFCKPEDLSGTYQSPQQYGMMVPFSLDEADQFETLTFSLTPIDCCKRCYSLRQEGKSCLGYGWADANPSCQIYTKPIVSPSDGGKPDICPLLRIGLVYNGIRGQGEYTYRHGPCRSQIYGCSTYDYEVCYDGRWTDNP